MTIKYKIASEEEVLNLRKLFLEVYKKEFTKDELHWRYIKNPLNKGKIYNCISLLDDEIVGHTAIMKHEFYYNNKIYYGGLTSGSTVSNKVTGIFPNLYFFLEDNCKSDFDFLYGLPNKNSSPFFLKLFGYSEIKYEIFQCNYTTEKSINKIEKISQNKFISNSFLLWRFNNHPIFDYNFYQYNDLIFYWKLYQNNELDIVYINNHNIFFDNFLEILKKLPKHESFNILTTSNDVMKNCVNFNFIKKIVPNKFVIKNINKLDFIDLIDFQFIDIDIF